MADRITPEQRSAIMSRIRSKDTRPEIGGPPCAPCDGLQVPAAREEPAGLP